MGDYVNPSSMNFRTGLNSDIYIDKSELIACTNKCLGTMNKFLCISRPRRFGKTMAADMLAAYYGCGEQTDALFDGLKIKSDASYQQHLNRYNVIKADMQYFMTESKTVQGLLELFIHSVTKELKKQYPEVDVTDVDSFPELLSAVATQTGKQFVILIDEWDCVMRRIHDWTQQKQYLDFLRNIMKDRPYIALAYMTGILPIKKYGEHSTLNMFEEYSMTDSHHIVPYFGFTKDEVKRLCEQYDMDFAEVKDWYDGYHFVTGTGAREKRYSIYSPRSVVCAMLNDRCGSYWTKTETYEALQVYIQMNLDGLKDSVVEMLAGASVPVDVNSFKNDMGDVHSKDEVLTLLVHLGYLTYNQKEGTVSIPNKEVEQEFVRSVNNTESYSEVAALIKESKDLLRALWEQDSETVAAGVEKAHGHFPALQYNGEQALSCTMELAFYYAQEYYTVIRELPAGKGFADICFLPKPNHADKPAVLMELKWNRSAETALDQIKRTEYPEGLKAYHGNLLLCGIAYDKDAGAEGKKHTCVIEQFEK